MVTAVLTASKALKQLPVYKKNPRRPLAVISCPHFMKIVECFVFSLRTCIMQL